MGIEHPGEPGPALLRREGSARRACARFARIQPRRKRRRLRAGKAELVNATHGQPGSASVRSNGAGIQAGLCGLPQGSIVALEATGKHHGLMAQRAHHAGMRVYEGRQSNGTTDARARNDLSSLGFAALRLRRIHTAWTRASAFSQSAQT